MILGLCLSLCLPRGSVGTEASHRSGLAYPLQESSEEGTRNVVAECVGKLTLQDPDTLLPKLK